MHRDEQPDMSAVDEVITALHAVIDELNGLCGLGSALMRGGGRCGKAVAGCPRSGR